MKSRKKYRFIRILLIFLMLVCLIQLIRIYYLSAKNKKQQQELREIVNKQDVEQNEDSAPQESEVNFFDRYMKLYQINPDIVGWLTIENTNIDYPVMQSDDNEYYLNHNFYGEKSSYGCLYVKNIADVNTPGTNFIVYGHNMKDGSMLGELDKYSSEEFCSEHATIIFDTFYERRIYDVLAAFTIKLYDDEDVFPYYQFYKAETEEDFLYFYQNVIDRALYDTGVTAEYGDSFITISTCAYQTDNSRFVLVGKLSSRL